uniref:J domain-containing protein n=1 Tax=Chenopodium quinoa TaxID=63459 RepID=A0A803KMA5_CHEQI
MNPYGQSGFVNSSQMNAKFEFSSPSTSNLGSEKPPFSSIPNLSRPRLVKSRKSQNPRSMGSSETRKIDPGFNPFRPVSDNLAGVSSRLEGKDDDEVYMNSNSSKNLNLKHPSNLASELPDKIHNLNLGGLGTGSSRGSGVGGSHGVHNVSSSIGTSLASELPNDLERLNLKDTGEIGSHNFGFGDSDSSKFVFGGNRTMEDSNDPSIASALPNRIKNLNIADPDKNSGTKKEMNSNMNNSTFGSVDASRTESGEEVDTMILDEMVKLKILGDTKESSDHANATDSSFPRTEPLGSISREDSKILYPTEFLNPIKEQKEHSVGPQVAEYHSNKGSGFRDASASSTSSLSSAGLHFQPARHEFEVPCTDGTVKKEGFAFGYNQESSRIPYVEFRTPDSKVQTGYSNKGLVRDSKSKGRKAKVKETKSVLMSFGNNFTSQENNFQNEPSESYSPMDVSPYRETRDDEQSSKEPSLTPENWASLESQAQLSNDATDEDLIRAIENMDINENNDMKQGEAEEQVSECTGNTYTCAAMASSPVDCVSAAESESFMSASENLDENGENEVESNNVEQNCDQTRYFSTESSASRGESSFTFAASSSAQGQASTAMRLHKKKIRMKVGPDIYIPARSAVLSDSQFSPISRVSVLPSQVVKSDTVPTAPLKGSKKITSSTNMSVGGSIVGGSIVGDAKKTISSPTAPARAAQEACEKWRLRGNQAYANGDLEKAEAYYSQGLSCIPQHETSRDCLRALVLCYSNRAAACMSRGRMREALRDCLVAADIDPSFFRVQLRAANCYLALGEIGNASLHFKRLLQLTDICVERKIILEASDGLQKAQKASEFMDHAARLLLQKTLADAETALRVISEALIISPYSEKLLESKAEALFMLRRYEEVVQLCGQTLETAEKNSPLLGADGQSPCLEASELLESYSFRIWRYCYIFKSNFYLGKLEEAVDFLEKKECWRSMVAKFGNETIESFIPQLSTAHELINHKSAGNGAFQAGKHKEAVEHYTAALSFNVESRPFSAVCFANRAAAYQALGQVTDAIADCSLAIALDEHYLKAISRRATLFEMIRDYEQAAKDLERLVSLLTKQAEEKSTSSGAYVPLGSVADLRQARQRLYQMEEQAKRGIPLNFYLILGVEPSVTAIDLKKAYRKAALRHHPDKAGQSLARAESGDDGLWKEIAEGVYKDADKLFKMIGEAYAVLSDPDKRFQYDIDEETRNGRRKSSSNASRMYTETSFNTAERGNSGGQWRDMWRSSANPYSRGFEPTRSGRFY